MFMHHQYCRLQFLRMTYSLSHNHPHVLLRGLVSSRNEANNCGIKKPNVRAVVTPAYDCFCLRSSFSDAQSVHSA